MRYLVNTIDGTITDVAGCVIVDTDTMDNYTYQNFIAMDDDDFIELAKTIGKEIQ